MIQRKLTIYITQIGHPNFRGGGNIVAHNLSRFFSARGHKVTTIYVSPKELLSEKPEPNYYRIILIKNSIIPFINYLKMARVVKKLFNVAVPDAIISLGYEGFLIPNIIRDKKMRILFIAASHSPFLRSVGFKELFLRWKWLNPLNFGKWLFLSSFFIDRLTKLKADFVQCLCKFGAEQCRTVYGVPDNKIFIIPNGVDVNRFNSQLPTAQNKTILFVGGSAEYKGLDILIKAIPAVIRKHPDIKILAAGEMDNRREELSKIAAKLGVAPKIEWIGIVPQSQMPEFYQRAYLTILPSRLDLFPIVILEAMASSVPVIATNVGGIPEIIENGVSGIIVQKENPDKLAKATIELLDDPQKAETMARRGRKIIEQKFTWEKVVEKYEKEIYSRLNSSITQQLIT